MDIIQIPFAKHVGIERKDESTLELKSTPKVQNHMQTVHASAQFTLAETQSGLYLQQTFPELEGKVLALLRGSTVKYKSPANTDIYAVATMTEEIKEKFLTQLERKGRTSIIIHVDILDIKDKVTMQGEFTWFVQQLGV